MQSRMNRDTRRIESKKKTRANNFCVSAHIWLKRQTGLSVIFIESAGDHFCVDVDDFVVVVAVRLISLLPVILRSAGLILT